LFYGIQHLENFLLIFFLVPHRAVPDLQRMKRPFSDAIFFGLLLVEMQTNGWPLRFSVTTANALRFAEWLAKATLSARELASFAG
jgi:hypothetical protein